MSGGRERPPPRRGDPAGQDAAPATIQDSHLHQRSGPSPLITPPVATPHCGSGRLAEPPANLREITGIRAMYLPCGHPFWTFLHRKAKQTSQAAGEVQYNRFPFQASTRNGVMNLLLRDHYECQGRNIYDISSRTPIPWAFSRIRTTKRTVVPSRRLPYVRIEDISAIQDVAMRDRLPEQLRVSLAELSPLRKQEHHVRLMRCADHRARVIQVRELPPGGIHRDRIKNSDPGAQITYPRGYLNRRRIPDVIGIWLERDSQNTDSPALHGSSGKFLGQVDNAVPAAQINDVHFAQECQGIRHPQFGAPC